MRDPHEAAGRVVAIDLARDDVVRAVHLAPRERTGLDGIVPLGRRAVHIPVKDGFRPAVGAVVDVLAAFDPALSAPGARATAATVARGARVLAVDDADRSGTEGGGGVTLLVTEGEAGAVAYAADIGSVSIALAPPEAACCTSSTSSPGP
jgi:Flp pilus assembly protein CpaB